MEGPPSGALPFIPLSCKRVNDNLRWKKTFKDKLVDEGCSVNNSRKFIRQALSRIDSQCSRLTVSFGKPRFACLYHQRTGITWKPQATGPFAARVDGQPRKRSGSKPTRLMPHWSTEKKGQKDFGNSSETVPLQPLFSFFICVMNGKCLILIYGENIFITYR